MMFFWTSNTPDMQTGQEIFSLMISTWIKIFDWIFFGALHITLIRHFRISEGDRFCLRNCAFAAIDIVFGLTRNAYSDKVKLMIRKLINTQSFNFVRYKFYETLFWKYYDCIKLAYIDFVLNYVYFTNSTLFDGDRWWFMFDT